MEERVQRILRNFLVLSKSDKQKQIIYWVKKGSKSIIPILKSIASGDSEVQIRFLARKGLFHLSKRFKEENNLNFEAKNFDDLIKLLDDTKKAESYARILNIGQLNFPSECREYILKQFDQVRSDDYFLATNLINLGKVGSIADIEVILSYIEHSDSRVRASVIESLGSLGAREVLPYLIRALRDEDNRIRANAIRALKLQGKKIVFESVQEMVKSEEVWMRSSAAFAIGEYKSPEVLEILSALLADKNDAVKKMAFKSLQKLAENGVIEANILLDRLDSIEEEESILDYLQITESNPDYPCNLDSLSAGDSRARLLEINRIVQGGIEDKYKELEERLVVEEDNFVNASLILALGQVKQESAVPLIKTFLSSTVPRLRANAIEALSSFQNPRFLPEVILNLEDSNNRARANAIIALKLLPYVDIYSPLRDMVESKDLIQQQSAFYAITEIGSEEALELLVKLVDLTKNEQLINNIREYILMLEDSDDSIGSLRHSLQHKIDFSYAQQTGFFTQIQDTEVSEEKLSSDLSEADFEGFTPDNLRPQRFDKIDTTGFVGATTEKKLLMIEQIKEDLNQEHYTVLRIAERDKDFQIKCIAKIALTAYKGKGFKEEDLSDLVGVKHADNGRSIFIPELNISRFILKYEGESTIHELNRELQKRTQDFKKTNFWGGRFGDQLPMLSALRMDTQEMICDMLGDDQFEIQEYGLCYFSPTYKPFLNGMKSLDGVNYENFVQLNMVNSMLLRQNETDHVSRMISSIAAPKYLMIIISTSNVFLFLRYALAYRRAEFVKFPLRLVNNVNLLSEGHFHQIIITFSEDQELILPRIQKANSERLMKALGSHLSSSTE